MSKENNKKLRKLNRQLWLFGWFKIRLIGFCRPRVTEINREKIRVRIPLNRRTKNHVNSMYLGVMTVGADLASGFLAFHVLNEHGMKSNPVFKGMKAEYFQRAESHVDFVCNEGPQIEEMIQEMKETGLRVTQLIEVEAICKNERVALFSMELSLKEIKKNV